MRVETDTLFKENVKSKKIVTQIIQEIWDTLKRLNLRIEEGEDSHLKGPKHIFNKVIVEKFPNLKKLIPIKVQEACRPPQRLEWG